MKSVGPAPGDPEEIQRILFSFAGKLAWDVGGNWGAVAERLCDRFQRVISFEPADESYSILFDTACRTRGLEAVQLAISDRDGEVVLAAQENSIRTGQLTTPDPSGVPESLTEGTWGRVLERRTVPCARLDTLAEEYGAPDFIKIDVEGHEGAVIRGGLTLLARCTPRLFIEIHNARLSEEIDGLLRPIYGEQLHVACHPHYRPGSWGYGNHFYLIAGGLPPAPPARRRPDMAVGRRAKETAVATRDIEADYRNACIEEYESYLRGGRTEAAETVASILRERYGHEVDAGAGGAERHPEQIEPAASEHAAAEKLPEAAVPEKPQRTEKPTPEPSAQAVRAWAKEQGIDVPPRGKLPADIVEAFKAAQG